MQVVSVNISSEKGTAKHPVPEIRIDENGVVGDAHAGSWHRQVSLLSEEIIARFAAELGRPIGPGEFAENLTTRGVDFGQVGLLDRFKVMEVELEVSQIGKECHGDGCAIFREVGRCVMPVEGVFCRVVRGGIVKPGDPILVERRPLRFQIITLSDRASRGEYPDRSGARIRELVQEFFHDKRWHLEIRQDLLPDEAEGLKAALERARDAGVDVVLTTGGTGVGPRDITPEVVLSLADKTLPGIMEHIRVKFGQNNPRALLSRSVAAVLGRTLVFALPGSVRAVEEYMGEILKVLEHLVLMIHGVDAHVAGPSA